MIRDVEYLTHVLEAIDSIEHYVSEGEEAFSQDAKTQDAAIRRLEVIGEAVKNISTELRAKFPDIPWRRIAGLRDKLIHGYSGIEMSRVWDVIEEWLPALKTQLAAILDELESSDS